MDKLFGLIMTMAVLMFIVSNIPYSSSNALFIDVILVVLVILAIAIYACLGGDAETLAGSTAATSSLCVARCV